MPTSEYVDYEEVNDNDYPLMSESHSESTNVPTPQESQRELILAQQHEEREMQLAIAEERRHELKAKTLGILRAGMDLAQSQERTKQMQANAQVEMTKTLAQHDVQVKAMDYEFSQRGKTLNELSDNMAAARQAGDREMVIKTMEVMAGIVTKSPLKDVAALGESYERKSNSPFGEDDDFDDF